MSKSSRGSSTSCHRSAAEANVVAWSQDQRVAVTSSEAIYVLTLKRPNLLQTCMENVSLPTKTQNLQAIDNPLITISSALAPHKDKLTPLNLDPLLSSQRILPGTSQGPKGNIDALFSAKENPSQSHDLFKASCWSPAGYNHLGGCILTALTASGRLLVYTPPGATGNSWSLALDITTHLPVLLSTPKTSVNGRDEKKETSHKEAAKLKNVAAKDLPNTRRSASVSMGDDDNAADTPRPKRARAFSSKGPVATDDYLRQRLLVAVSTCAWSPTLLLVHGGVIGVIAIATRTGRVALIGVKLPIVIGKNRNEDDAITLLCDCQLPLGDEKETAITEAWCSSLSWLPSTSISTPTFYMSPGQGGRVHARMIVGCTNGQMFCLHWELNGTGGGGDGGEQVSSSVSSVNGVTGVCSITGVSRVTGCVSEITRVWEEIDNIPVYSVACQSQVSSDGSLWLVFGKSNILMATKFDSTYKQVNSCVQIAGYHGMTISGVAAFAERSFVSSALDGSVQTFCLDASNIHDGHVTPSGVVMETQGEKKVTAHGVAVSEMGLFIAVSINNSENTTRTIKKMQMNSQLHFITISSENEVENIIKEQTCCKWDVCEYVRKDITQLQKIPSLVNDLCTLMSKSKVLLPVSKLQFLLQITTIMGKREEADQCKADITRRHVGNSLKSWLEWEKRPVDTTLGKEGVDSQSSLCVQLMARWLLYCVAHPTVSETKLANKVLSDVGPKSASKAGSQITAPLEVCPACNDPVPLTDLRQDTCGKGHRWSRCGLTLCLAADAHCSSCLQCGATVNNALTISVEAGSWLNSLLQQHTCCIYCGGYFELVV